MGSTMGKSSGNFLDGLPSQGTLHVVMLGLDSAGKTTALYRLKFDQYLNTVPTIGFNCEKVQGTVGKAKGVQFLVWDVGGQEKLRPLWRSYTRCTDGILFVVDSVDVERMEEAKMELMRTAKCPDNQGVPVLILANKQDLPGARDAKELEKLLGLHELIYPVINLTSMSSSSSSTGNIVGCSSTTSTGSMGGSHASSAQGSGSNAMSKSTSTTSSSSCRRSLTPTSQHNKSFDFGANHSLNNKELNFQFPALLSSSTHAFSSSSLMMDGSVQATTMTTTVSTERTLLESVNLANDKSSESSSSTTATAAGTGTGKHGEQKQYGIMKSFASSPSSAATTPTVAPHNSLLSKKNSSSSHHQHQHHHHGHHHNHYKGWFIQPACAITGEGLQEGLEALYEMILKRRKLNKAFRKKR